MFHRRNLSLALLVIALSTPLPRAQDRPPVDLHGDPLPPGALARLGTVRFRAGDDTGAYTLSPDGKTLASAERFHIRFWDLATGKETRDIELSGGGYLVLNLLFTAGGRQVIAVAVDDDNFEGTFPTVFVIDAAAGKVVRQFRSDRLGGLAVELSPNGRFLLIHKPHYVIFQLQLLGREDTELGATVWDLTTGRPWQTFDEAWSLALAADGETLAVAEKDGTVSLHDLSTGRTRFRFRAHQTAVTALAFSPDGRTLATGGGILIDPLKQTNDFTVRLWETASGRERATFTSHTQSVNTLTFSPDGRFLESRDSGDTHTLWDIRTGRQYRHWPTEPGRFLRLCVTPDGRRLFWSKGDGLLHEEQTDTGKELRRWSPGGEGPWHVQFTPDGRFVMREGTAFSVWDHAQGKRLLSFRGHSAEVRQILFAPHGRTVATCDENEELWLWDRTTSRPLLPASDSAPLNVHRFGFSADGHTLVTVGSDGVVRQWDALTGRRTGEFRIGDARTLALWRQCLGTKNFLPLAHYPDRCVVFGPGCRTLAVVSGDRAVDLWDVAAGKRLYRKTELLGLSRELVFSPDGGLLAVHEGDRALRIWKVDTGEEQYVISQKPKEPLIFAFAPDSKALAWSKGPTAHLLDLATGKNLHDLPGRDRPVERLGFSGDGSELACHSERVIRLWHVASGKELRAMAGKEEELGRVNLQTAPDGSLWATVSMDSKNSRWELRHLATGRTVVADLWERSPLAFSSDGRTVAAATHTVAFHDTATGKELGNVDTRQRGLVTALAFSPDGRVAATGSADGSVVLWDWRKACKLREKAFPFRKP